VSTHVSAIGLYQQTISGAIPLTIGGAGTCKQSTKEEQQQTETAAPIPYYIVICMHRLDILPQRYYILAIMANNPIKKESVLPIVTRSLFLELDDSDSNRE
jgi:hypothetical protein